MNKGFVTSGFRGRVQVYTGDGKGKTTAAFGLALRAAGNGMGVFIGQFLKKRPSGEIRAAAKLRPLIVVRKFGREGLIFGPEGVTEDDILRGRKGLQTCLRAMLSGRYHLMILDEIHTALHFRILTEAEVHEFLDRRPDGVEVVLTGRCAPSSIIDRADLVTEMKSLKHYYDAGVPARRGIES
jgi:cob(I)alamin adenosyltransferase